MNCKKCGTELQDNIDFCPDCGESTENNEVKAPGMKWYKYQAYFVFPVSAILNLLNSVLFLPGVLKNLINLIPDMFIRQTIDGSTYFLNYDSVKVLNFIIAFIMIAIAFYYAYISFELIKFKKGALKHLYISLVLSEVAPLIYLTALTILTKNIIEFDAETIIMLVREVITHTVSVIFWMWVYSEYYNKRKYMFVN